MTATNYVLFAGATYYARGGMSDYRGSFARIKDAKAAFAALPDEDKDWGQIGHWNGSSIVPLLAFPADITDLHWRPWSWEEDA